MNTRTLLAAISRDFFRAHHVFTYCLKKVADMTEDELISKCHFYCEANKLTDEFQKFRASVESEYRYCGYLMEFVDDGLCTDVQMIANGYILPTALPEYVIDRKAALAHCADCRFEMKG